MDRTPYIHLIPIKNEMNEIFIGPSIGDLGGFGFEILNPNPLSSLDNL